MFVISQIRGKYVKVKEFKDSCHLLDADRSNLCVTHSVTQGYYVRDILFSFELQNPASTQNVIFRYIFYK